MKKGELLRKTKGFAVRIIKLSQFIREKRLYSLSEQIFRSGTSIGANAHEAQSAESKKNFISKMTIALKEAREVQYWLDIMEEPEIIPKSRLTDLQKELNEITKILVSIIKTSKERYIK